MNPPRLMIVASASLLLAATFVGCHRHDDGSASRVLSSITVTPTNPSIAHGTSAQFTAIGIYSDGYTVDLTGTAAWSSSDVGVATVSGGLASGAAVGLATIRATDSASSVSGSTTLTVTSAVLVSIEVTPTNPSIAMGTTQQLAATGTFSDGSTQDLTSAVAFDSSDTAVATVGNGLAAGAAVGMATITATDLASGIHGSTTLTVTAAVLVSIAVTPTQPSIALGTTQAFTATGVFSDSSTQDLTGSVVFDSSDTAIATVTNGIAASVAVGATTITATDLASGVHGSTTLTVTSAVLVSIAVAPATPSIALGTTQQFAATGTYSDSSTQDLTASVTWSSSSAATAVVSNAPGSRGLAASVAVGLTTVVATDPASGIHGSTTLAVTAAVLVSIEVTPTHPAIALGTTQQFTATGTYSDDSTQDLTGAVTWSSTSSAAATVSNAPGSRGLAASVAVGSTTITATDPASGVAGSTTLDVTAAVLVAIDVTPANPSIALGTAQPFAATGTYSDGSTQDLTGAVTWNSSLPAAAVVSNAGGSNGLATSVAVGATTVAATDPASGIAGATTLDVTAAVLVSIAVTPTNPSIALGTAQQLAATGTYSDSTTQDLTGAVTFSSSDPGVATASGGLASGVAVGLATITATDPATGIHGSTTLTVTAAVLVSIAVTPADPSIALGTAQQFAATGTYSDATTQDLTDSVTWSASSAAAAVSNAPASRGLATSLAVGAATITATDTASGVAGATTLDVTPAVLVSIAVTPTNPSIALGTAQQFAATGTYSDATTQDLTDSVTWSSATPAAAVVSNASGSEGLAASVAVGLTTISAADPSSGISGSTTLTVTAAVLTSIAVTPTNPSIALGTAQQFAATGTYSDASTQDLTGSVTWSSATPAAATVSNAPASRGLATSVAVGSTTISAVDSASGVSGSTTLDVSAAVLVSISVAPTNPSIALGTAQQFTATGIYSDASVQDLTGSATWGSATPAAAVISNAPASRGLATSVAVGTTTIAATDPANGVSGSTTLSVTAAVLVSIAVTPADPSLALGTTQQFAATGTYSDGSTQDLTGSATWSSSTPAAATVSNAPASRGLATSVAVGFTTVSATDAASGVQGSTSLTVTAAVLVSIAVTPANPSIALGTTQQFAATGTYSDATTQDLTASVTWSSSTPAAATVSNAPASRGLATSVAVGSTTIGAADPSSGVSGSTSLSVSAAALVSIAVTPAAPSIVQGSTQQFAATGTYSDASTQTLTSSATWSSSSTSVATVSNAPASHGLASGVAVGTATITATDPSSGVFGSTTLSVFADIALRGASSGSAASGVLSLVIARPGGTTTGDVLIASICVRPSTAAITAPAGWTLVRRIDNASGIANSLAVYRRTAAAGEPASYTWTLSTSTGSAGGVSAFSGVDTSSPIDVENGQSTASSLTHATPSVTTASARTMIVTAHAFSSSASWTPPTGMAEAFDVACDPVPSSLGMSIEGNYVLQTAAGATGAKSAVAGNDADGGNTHILALRRAP